MAIETDPTVIPLLGTANARRLEFRYDYLNRRVEKLVRTGWNGSTYATVASQRRHLYDGDNIAVELSGDGSVPLRSYTWALDLAGSLTATGGVGALVQITDHTNGASYCPTYDGNGNVASLLNTATGSIAAAYEYSPSGELLRCAGSYATSNPFRFSTKFTDDETGLVYYGARFFSPSLGRFINRDPIEEAGGLNLYGFCRNDAINGVDYRGMEPPTMMEPFIVKESRFDPTFDLSEAYFTGGPNGYQSGGSGSTSTVTRLKNVPESLKRAVMIGANGAYFVNVQPVRLGPDNEIFFDGPWSENKPSTLAFGSFDNPVMLPPFHVTASRIRDSVWEFGAGLAKVLATGFLATIVTTVLVTAAPATVPVPIDLGAIASLNGLHEWAERGYPVTAQGTGELIGTIAGGGFSARAINAAMRGAAERAPVVVAETVSRFERAAAESVTASGIKEGATIYRVFGGESRALGRSWTTVAPDAVSDFRAAAGLFEVNTGEYVITARLKSLEGFSVRQALPGPTTPPGALQIPELLFEKPPVPGMNIEIIGGGGWKP